MKTLFLLILVPVTLAGFSPAKAHLRPHYEAFLAGFLQDPAHHLDSDCLSSDNLGDIFEIVISGFSLKGSNFPDFKKLVVPQALEWLKGQVTSCEADVIG